MVNVFPTKESTKMLSYLENTLSVDLYLSGETNKIQKLILTFSLCVFSMLILTQSAHQYTGYEFSLIAALPLYHWAGLGILFFLGVYILFQSSDKNWANWKTGLLVVLMAHFLLMIIPISRGYFMYGKGDPVTHRSFVEYIVATGAIPEYRHPLIHSLGAGVTFVTNISSGTIVTLVPLVVSLFCLISLFLVAKILLSTKRAILIAFCFSLFTASPRFTPFHIGLLFLPFLMYVYLRYRKHKQTRNTLILSCLLVLLVPLHALVALFGLVLIIAYEVSIFIANDFSRPHPDSSPAYIPVLILGSAFTLWYIILEFLLDPINRILISYFGPVSQTTKSEKYASLISKASEYPFEILEVGFYRYGRIGLIIGVFSLCALIFMWNVAQKRWDRQNASVFSLVSVGSFLLITVASIFTFTIVGFVRMFLPIILFAPIIIGTTVDSVLDIDNNRFKQGIKVVLLLILVLLAVHHIIAFYPAVEEKHTHRQITEEKYEGGVWFLNYANQEYETHTFQAGLHRVADLSEAKRGKITPSRYRWTPRIKEEFNYRTQGTSQTYVIVTITGIEYYPRAFPKFHQRWAYSPEGFEQFSTKENRIYDSGSYCVVLAN